MVALHVDLSVDCYDLTEIGLDAVGLMTMGNLSGRVHCCSVVLVMAVIVDGCCQQQRQHPPRQIPM